MSQQLKKNKDSHRIKKYLFFIFIIFVTIWSLPIKFLVEEKGYFLTKLPGWPPIPTEIPSEIVKSKDCEAYHKWAHETLHIGSNDKVDRSICPWDNSKLEKVAHFTINGMQLNVPREYVTFMGNRPDGEIEQLNLAMLYPDMTSLNNGKYQFHNEISLFLETSNSQTHICIREFKEKCNFSQWAYEKDLKVIDHKTFKTKFSLKEIGFISELNALMYKQEHTNDEFYIQGDYKSPTYWLLCWNNSMNREDARCRSTFYINEKMYIEMRMSSKLLKNHLDVRKKILEKFQEWQQPIKLGK